jgi:transcriptional regulator with XRE-family HTH domain
MTWRTVANLGVACQGLAAKNRHCLPQCGGMCLVASSFDIPSRVRAARHLAGFKNPRALAARIDQRGLGEKTLYLIEQGHGDPQIRDLEAIAEACGVPLEWFSADFSRLAEISDDARRVIARETAAAVERSRDRRAGPSASSPAHPAEGEAP